MRFLVVLFSFFAPLASAAEPKPTVVESPQGPLATDLPTCHIQVNSVRGTLAKSEAENLRLSDILRARDARIKALESDLKSLMSKAEAVLEDSVTVREDRDQWRTRAETMALAITAPAKCRDACAALGLCSFTLPSMQCMAVRDADCAKAFVCTSGEQCRAVNGSCVK